MKRIAKMNPYGKSDVQMLFHSETVLLTSKTLYKIHFSFNTSRFIECLWGSMESRRLHQTEHKTLHDIITFQMQRLII